MNNFNELNNNNSKEFDLYNNYNGNNQIFENNMVVYNNVGPKVAKEDEKMKNENGKNSNYNLSKDFLKILGLIVSGVLLVLSLLTGAKSFVPAQKSEELLLHYSVTNKADYKVNLVANDFYETSSLGKGELVPVTFIKDIEIDLSSVMSANKQINVNYNYRVTGTITAKASDNGQQDKGGKVWTKNYIFVAPTSKMENNTGYTVTPNKIVIDYGMYNDLVNQYKLMAAIPMEASLTVTLTVEATSSIDGTPLEEESSVSVDIPLSVSTVMIKTSNDETNQKTLISTTEIEANNNYTLLAISAVIFIGSLIATLFLLKSLRKMTEDHSLFIKFNKIMRDYNQVIIEIEELPEVKDAAVIEVKTFKDMLDIQKELHLPIMCSKAKDENLTNNIFYIINQNQIFKYRLNNENERF